MSQIKISDKVTLRDRSWFFFLILFPVLQQQNESAGCRFQQDKTTLQLTNLCYFIKRSGSFSIFALSLSGPITTGKTLTVLQKGIWVKLSGAFF
jgi:hypothetical protein